MPNIVTPPLLLDSTGSPANGTIFVRATSPFTYLGNVVTTAAGYGVVRSGILSKAGNGGVFFLPPTPAAVAFELVLFLTETRDGQSQKRTITRLVTVPDTATAGWSDLVDVVADVPGVDYIIPPWIADLMDSLVASDAATAANVNDTGSDTRAALDVLIAAATSAATANSPILCKWVIGTGWRTLAGATVPTTATLVRHYKSQNHDPATVTVTAPTFYNVLDEWLDFPVGA